MKNVKCLRCIKCGKEYEALPDATTCECGGILDVVLGSLLEGVDTLADIQDTHGGVRNKVPEAISAPLFRKAEPWISAAAVCLLTAIIILPV